MREEEFATVYKIMSESFPVDERRTFDEQIGLLTNPLFEILVRKVPQRGNRTFRAEKIARRAGKSLSGSRAAGNGTSKAPDRILSQKRFLYERISVYTTSYFQGHETPSAYNNDYRRRN